MPWVGRFRSAHKVQRRVERKHSYPTFKAGGIGKYVNHDWCGPLVEGQPSFYLL